MDGVSEVEFSGTGAGDYYVAVRHRNHLGAMTAAPVTIGLDSVLVNFTHPATDTYGTLAQKQISGARVLWAGNCVTDGILKYSGLNNDRDAILQRIGGSVPTNFVNGYFIEDANMDGVVKYAGAANDRDIILTNIGGVVPTATRLEQLP